MAFFPIVIFVLTILTITLETSVTMIPFVFVGMLLLFILEKKPWVFFYAVLIGTIIDILSLRTVGLTGLFFIIFLYLVSLYERKYEIQTYPFLVVSSFIGGMIYLKLFRDTFSLFDVSIAVIVSCIGLFIYTFTARFVSKK